jgi:hypothetical protein
MLNDAMLNSRHLDDGFDEVAMGFMRSRSTHVDGEETEDAMGSVCWLVWWFPSPYHRCSISLYHTNNISRKSR